MCTRGGRCVSFHNSARRKACRDPILVVHEIFSCARQYCCYRASWSIERFDLRFTRIEATDSKLVGDQFLGLTKVGENEREHTNPSIGAEKRFLGQSESSMASASAIRTNGRRGPLD